MTIVVSFKAKSLDHMDEVTDRIRKVAGKNPDASGFCFFSNERDLDFSFRDKRRGSAFASGRAGKRQDSWDFFVLRRYGRRGGRP